jgi:hypothetical protein
MDINQQLKLLSLQHQLGVETINTADCQSNIGLQCQILSINHYIQQANNAAMDIQLMNAVDKAEHWTTINGARVLIDGEGSVISGAGGKLSGKSFPDAVRGADKSGVHHHDDMMTAIAKKGGLSRSEAIKQGIDPAMLSHKTKGGHRLFNNGKNAMSYDHAAEIISQYGYEANDANDLVDKVSRSVNQGEYHYTPEGSANQADNNYDGGYDWQHESRKQSVMNAATEHDAKHGTKYHEALIKLANNGSLDSDELSEWESDLGLDDYNAIDSQVINAVDSIEETQQNQSIDLNADNDIIKDEAIETAIAHIETDENQSDIPESEKPEDAALVETLKQSLSQKERYPKIGGITIAGLPLAIENSEHSTREGVDPNGQPWSVTMSDHYGYIEGFIGHDGDELDMFLKPGTPSDWQGNIYCIEQTNPQGEYDEDKVMIGYDSEDEAIAAYMRNYSDDWQGFSNIETYPIDDFIECCNHLSDVSE